MIENFISAGPRARTVLTTYKHDTDKTWADPFKTLILQNKTSEREFQDNDKNRQEIVVSNVTADLSDTRQTKT